MYFALFSCGKFIPTYVFQGWKLKVQRTLWTVKLCQPSPINYVWRVWWTIQWVETSSLLEAGMAAVILLTRCSVQYLLRTGWVWKYEKHFRIIWKNSNQYPIKLYCGMFYISCYFTSQKRYGFNNPYRAKMSNSFSGNFSTLIPCLCSPSTVFLK